IKDSIILAAKNSLMMMITSAKKVHNSKISLDLVEENFKVINKMYEQGMVKGDDLLDAETMRTASKLELVSAYYDFILANYELRKWTNN
ncbi:MAG: TolC family protein, partial [Candidatus Cloacimonetes bacterium]|nr:TolC family protein [Candidatus Cloacimonadota bacterium]